MDVKRRPHGEPGDERRMPDAPMATLSPPRTSIRARIGPPRVVLTVVPWVVIVLLWYAIAYSGLISPSLVPTPHAVAARFWALLTEGRLISDMWMSTQRVFLGVASGIIVAVPV